MQIGFKKLFFLAGVFLLLWFTVRLFLPLFSPFLAGTVLALASEPVVRFLSGRMRLPRCVGSGIGVTTTFFLFSMLLLLICAFFIRQLSALSGILPDLAVSLQDAANLLQAWLLNLASRTPGSIRPLLQENIGAFFSSGAALLEQSLRYVLGFAGSLLSHLPDSALTLGTAILSGFMISAKLPRIRVWLGQHLSAGRLTAIQATGKRVRQTVCAWMLAQTKLTAVTFGILLAGFTLLRIPRPLLWAFGVSLVDAFPVLGTGTILIPWALIRLLQADTARAIGLAGIYLTVSLIRSALEPRLVGQQLGLDPLVTLIVLYAGFRLWGIGGMLLAPLLTVIILQVLPDRR